MNKIIYPLFLLLLVSCDDPFDDNRNNLSPNLSSAEYDGLANGIGTGTPTGGDQYAAIEENPFIDTQDENTSAFSVDTDGASYANMRRFLVQDGYLPPKDAIRTEELVNYFKLDYEYKDNFHPIYVNSEISGCMWDDDHRLLRIGIKAKDPYENNFPPSNFVFLIDVSGSMTAEDKLPLLKEGFKLFVDQMTSDDRVAIVTYAGAWGLALPSTNGDFKEEIKAAIDELEAGGTTAGSEGIISAYKIAEENFIDGGNNRIIIGTDGDFNVGVTDHEALIKLIEKERDKGIFLSVFGVGRGNLNDATLEQIADNGNGNYEYIDNLAELNRVFLYERSKFFTVAKDVKVQLEFNPSVVEAYRLIGYENRVLENEDFENDAKDAGDIAAGQNVTALYELKMASVDPRSQSALEIKFRYKQVDSNNSVLFSHIVQDSGAAFNESSDLHKFTASVASFGLLLRDSQYKGNTSFEKILNTVDPLVLTDEYGLKAEFSYLVDLASSY